MYKSFFKLCAGKACALAFVAASVLEVSAVIDIVVTGGNEQAPERIVVSSDGNGGFVVPEMPGEFHLGDVTLSTLRGAESTILSFSNEAGMDYQCRISHGIISLFPELEHINYGDQVFRFRSKEGIDVNEQVGIQTRYDADREVFLASLGGEAELAAPEAVVAAAAAVEMPEFAEGDEDDRELKGKDLARAGLHAYKDGEINALQTLGVLGAAAASSGDAKKLERETSRVAHQTETAAKNVGKQAERAGRAIRRAFKKW